MEKQFKRTVKAGLILFAVGLLLGAVIVYAVTPSSTFYISNGIYPGAPSFTVWMEGSNYFAKDANGQLKYSGTNASEIINDAISDIPSTGGRILLENANYTLDTPLNLLGKYSLEIYGETTGHSGTTKGTILSLADNADTNLILKNETSSAFFYIMLRGLTLYGNKDGQTDTNALIYMKNVWWLRIENLVISESKSHAIHLDSCRWVWITHNDIGISDGGQNDGDGIRCNGVSPAWIIDNSIIQNDNGIFLVSDAGVVEDVRILGNQIVRNTGDGVYIGKGLEIMWLVDISDNTINENDHHGVSINGVASNVTNCKICNNVIVSNDYNGVGYDGIYIDKGNNLIISNNHISDLNSKGQRYGIWEKAGDNNTFTSNHCLLNSLAGIIVTGLNTHVCCCWNGTTWISEYPTP